MKIPILALASLLGTAQTAGWVERCCILACKHPNDPRKDQCKDKRTSPTP